MNLFRDVAAVIFDLDGVLVNSESLQVAAEKHVCRKFRLRVPAREWAGFKGKTNAQIFRYIIDKYGRGSGDVATMTSAKIAFMFESIRLNGLEQIAGSEDFLRFVCAHPSISAVALATSSGRLLQQTVFDRLDLHRFFDKVVTCEDVRFGKPHPEPYLLAAAQLGVDPKKCLVVEDSDNGVISGKAAGCRVLGITTSFPREVLLNAGADHVVDTYSEAIRLFG